MANNFRFVGKLSIPKGSDKFKPYSENTSASGWKSRKLMFNVKAKGNIESCELFGGYSEKNPIIYGYTKGENGEKGKSVQIPWSKRQDEKVIENQAQWKLSTIKLDDDVSMKFLSHWDMIQSLRDLLELPEYKEKTYAVTGNIEYQNYKGKVYTKYIPQRITVVDGDEVEETLEGTIELHFGEDAITDNFDDNKKIFISGFAMQYDGTAKKDLGVKVENLELDLSSVDEEKAEKMYKLWIKKVLKVTGDEYMKIGLKVKFINGTEQKEFTLDMLDEEQKEFIEMGLMTFEEVKKEMSSGYGERVKSIKINGLAKGYSKGAQETGMTLEDYLPEVEVFDDEDEIDDNDKSDDLDLDLDLDLD